MGLDSLYRDYLADAPQATARLAMAVDAWLHQYFAKRFDHDDTHDLVQSANETIWRKLPSFVPEHDHAFHRWVSSIARTHSLRARSSRHRARVLPRELDTARLGHPGTGPRTGLERRQRAELLRSELKHLPAPYRRAVEDLLAGGDLESFAKREGIAPGTARSRRHRGRAELERRIQRRLQTPSTPST